MENLQPDELAVLDRLYRRCFGATLHRLRNTRGLLVGWAALGGGTAVEKQVQECCAEDAELLSRLEHLVQSRAAGLSLEAVDTDLARAFLSSAVGMGTPREAGSDLPETDCVRTALALALWAEAVGAGRSAAEFHRVPEGGWRLTVIEPAGLAPEGWAQRYGDLLADPPSARELHLAPGRLLEKAPAYTTEDGATLAPSTPEHEHRTEHSL